MTPSSKILHNKWRVSNCDKNRSNQIFASNGYSRTLFTLI